MATYQSRAMWRLSVAPLLAILLAGCGIVLGLDEFVDAKRNDGLGGAIGGGGGFGGDVPTGSAGTGQAGGQDSSGIDVSPHNPQMGALRMLEFSASKLVDWSVQEPNGGRIDADGRYFSPAEPGTFHIIATSKSDTNQSMTTAVSVMPLGIAILGGHPSGRGTIDGPLSRARFMRPLGIGIKGEELFIADQEANTIRQIKDGGVSTFAGQPLNPGSIDAIGTSARFSGPTAVAFAIDENAQPMWVLDANGTCIRRLHLLTGSTTTLAGECGTGGRVDGVGTAARLEGVTSMVYSYFDGALYLRDSQGIRRVNLNNAEVTSVIDITGGAGESLAAYGDGIYFGTDTSIDRLNINANGIPTSCSDPLIPGVCITPAATTDERADMIAISPTTIYASSTHGLYGCPMPATGTTSSCSLIVESNSTDGIIDGAAPDARIDLIPENANSFETAFA